MPKTAEENAAILARIAAKQEGVEHRATLLAAFRCDTAAAQMEREETETIETPVLDRKGRLKAIEDDSAPGGIRFETRSEPTRRFKASDLRRRRAARKKLREAAGGMRERAAAMRGRPEQSGESE